MNFTRFFVEAFLGFWGTEQNMEQGCYWNSGAGPGTESCNVREINWDYSILFTTHAKPSNVEKVIWDMALYLWQTYYILCANLWLHFEANNMEIIHTLPNNNPSNFPEPISLSLSLHLSHARAPSACPLRTRSRPRQKLISGALSSAGHNINNSMMCCIISSSVSHRPSAAFIIMILWNVNEFPSTKF